MEISIGSEEIPLGFIEESYNLSRKQVVYRR